MSNESNTLRQQLVDAMRGYQAHIDFDAALKDFPVSQAGAKPDGVPHSAWQLLEHMRIAQEDILEFSRDARHASPSWPEGYWPSTQAPPDEKAWRKSVEAFRKSGLEMQELIENPAQELLQPLEHGKGQTLLREALLIANHNSYHLGQLVLLKKMLAGIK